jgi:uncharacterized protein YjiS (DUF1127 family)
MPADGSASSPAFRLWRVIGQFIDTLADYYGEIMYPSFFERIDAMDGPALREAPYHREAFENRHWSEGYGPSEAPPRWGDLASTREAAAPRRWYAPIVSVLAWLRDSLRRADEQRRAMQALERLDDHALNDIGITRDQIDRVIGLRRN